MSPGGFGDFALTRSLTNLAIASRSSSIFASNACRLVLFTLDAISLLPLVKSVKAGRVDPHVHLIALHRDLGMSEERLHEQLLPEH